MPGTRISITVDGQTLTGTLDHNSTASALLEQLPLELTLRDFGGQEKVAALPSALPLEGMPAGSAPAGGGESTTSTPAASTDSRSRDGGRSRERETR